MSATSFRVIRVCAGLALLLLTSFSCGGSPALKGGGSVGPDRSLSQASEKGALPLVGAVTTLGPGGTFTLQTSRGQTFRLQLTADTRPAARSMSRPAGSQVDLQLGARLCVSTEAGPGDVLRVRRLLRLDFPVQASAALSVRPAPNGGPTARIYHHAVYRARSDEMFIFAGQAGPSWFNEVRDLWSYHVRTGRWEYLGEQPAAASNLYTPVYDCAADRIVMYVAMDGDGNILSTPETWAFDPVSRTWENRQAANPPSPRWGAMMAYDARTGKTVLFGGGDFRNWLPLNETWTYDYPTNAWTQLHPAAAPLPINFGAMAYDIRAGLIVMFSGNHWYDETWEGWNLDETWTLDVNKATWALVPTAYAPAPRNYHRMDYDPWRGEILMFGGCTGTDVPGDPLVPQNDTWAFNTRTGRWRQFDPRTVPGPMGWHSLVFAGTADRAVVFGGGTSRETATRATWVYLPEPSRWMNVLE